MKNIIFALLLAHILMSPESHAERFNQRANYLSTDGESVAFIPNVINGVREIVLDDGITIMPMAVKEDKGFVRLSYFYIPLATPQSSAVWTILGNDILELTKITTDDNGELYYHFACTDPLLASDGPIVSYVYSERRGVIMFELLTDHPVKRYHKSYVLIDEAGVGKVLSND